MVKSSPLCLIKKAYPNTSYQGLFRNGVTIQILLLKPLMYQAG